MDCKCKQKKKARSLECRGAKVLQSLNYLHGIKEKLMDAYNPEKEVEELVFPEGDELLDVLDEKFEFLYEQLEKAGKDVESVRASLKGHGLDDIPPEKEWKKYEGLTDLFQSFIMKRKFKKALDHEIEITVGSALTIANKFREIREGAKDRKFGEFARVYENKFRELALKYDVAKEIETWARIITDLWEIGEEYARISLDQGIKSTKLIASGRTSHMSDDFMKGLVPANFSERVMEYRSDARDKKLKKGEMDFCTDIIHGAYKRAEGCYLVAEQAEREGNPGLAKFAREYEEKYRALPKTIGDMKRKRIKEEIDRSYV